MPLLGYELASHKSQGSIVDSSIDIRGVKNYTCVKRLIPFKLSKISILVLVYRLKLIVESNTCWLYQHIFCDWLNCLILLVVHI